MWWLKYSDAQVHVSSPRCSLGGMAAVALSFSSMFANVSQCLFYALKIFIFQHFIAYFNLLIPIPCASRERGWMTDHHQANYCMSEWQEAMPASVDWTALDVIQRQSSIPSLFYGRQCRLLVRAAQRTAFDSDLTACKFLTGEDTNYLKPGSHH